jgi:hypothetical protein
VRLIEVATSVHHIDSTHAFAKEHAYRPTNSGNATDLLWAEPHRFMKQSLEIPYARVHSVCNGVNREPAMVLLDHAESSGDRGGFHRIASYLEQRLLKYEHCGVGILADDPIREDPSETLIHIVNG